MLAAPFFHWRVVLVKADIRVNEGFSMFQVVKAAFSKGYTDSSWAKFLVILMGLLLMVSGIWVLYFAFRDQWGKSFLKPEHPVERFFGRFRLISHIIPPVLAMTSVVVLERTLHYTVLYDRMNETYLSWQSLMLDGYHDWKLPGLGAWFLYLGIGLYIFTEAFRYLIETLNEDD